MRIGLGLHITRGGGAGEPPAPAAPVNTAVPVVTGTTEVGQTLSCSTGTWTGFPAPTFAYQWQDDAVNIAAATSSTYLLTASEVGGSITCEVTGTNASGSATAESVGVGPVTAAPGATDNLLLETNDNFLLESGDLLLLEGA